jgi:hypothetical protein
MVSNRSTRRWLLFAGLLAIVTVFASAPVKAAPGDDEGGSEELRKALDVANRAYLEADATLQNSRKRQAELTQKLADLEQKVAALRDNANYLAGMAYRNNPLRTTSALLASASPENFVDRAAAANTVALRNGRKLREYGQLRKDAATAKAEIDAEVTKQEQQVAEMERRKKDAEKALAAAGGGQKSSGFGGNSQKAQPAPRQANGQLPPQGCTIDDPTTSGCITARMLNAYNQARAAGFTHYTACYRSGGGGEHPKGRACDFAAAVGTFGGVATGAERTYGNNLAAYFVNNAGALGVLYVIWFLQIWQPSTGWRTYGGACGNPACNHQNHVHLSVV